MKKYVSLVLAIILCILPMSVGVYAADSQIAIASVQGAPGEEIAVQVNISGNPGLAYLKLKVGYSNTDLTLVRAENTGLLQGTFTTSQYVNVNPYVLQWMNAGDSYGDGIIATLIFKINETASTGDKEITLSFEECYNQNLDDVVFAVSNGTVSVQKPVPETPSVQKFATQLRFFKRGDTVEDKYDFRMISAIPAQDWDNFFVDANGEVNIIAVGFIAANTSYASSLSEAQTALENDRQLPTGWKTANTNYIQKADAQADAYFGCLIQGIAHSAQTEDIVCSAYVAYRQSNGEVAYAWFEQPTVAAVHTKYDSTLQAWLDMYAK